MISTPHFAYGIVLFVAVVLIMVALVMPGWWVVEFVYSDSNSTLLAPTIESGKSEIGVLRARICQNKDCQSYERDTASLDNFERGVVAFALFAFLFALMGCVWSIALCCCADCCGFSWMLAISSTLGGVFMVASAALYGHQADSFNYGTYYCMANKSGLGYCFYVAVTAAALLFVGAVLGILYIKYEEAHEEEEADVPMEDPSGQHIHLHIHDKDKEVSLEQ